MFISENLAVNEKGHLTIGNIDTIDLAHEYKTPLYVMDEELIRKNIRRFKSSIDVHYSGNGLVCYAAKAFMCKEICRIMADEGAGLDVVSGGELFTAMSVNFPAEKLIFHGNNKTYEELTLALNYGVGRIVVDNIDELNRLNKLAGNLGKRINIMFRIKPGIDAHTHDFVRTGQIDSKFGLAYETGEAFNVIKHSLEMENLTLVGLHCHIGSQIFDTDPFELAAQVMLDLCAQVKKELAFDIKELNLGGGFGIKYLPNHNTQPYETYMERVAKTVKVTCEKHGIATPFILIEPGRSIVGPTGITLYTVGSIKNIPNVRTYVSVDGGMSDNPRYALYKSEYDVLVANHANEPKDSVITLAGSRCESGDLIGEGMKIQTPTEGDIVAVLATGAYNYSMASNYNRVPRPAVVMVSGGKSRIVVNRESYEDVCRNDM